MNRHFTTGELAFYNPALVWAGDVGMMTTHGARKAAKYARQDIQFSLATGKDLQDSGWKSNDKDFWKNKNNRPDSVWLVSVQGGKTVREKVADKWKTFKKALKKAMGGALNGGDTYDAYQKRKGKAWAAVILGVTIAATVVVSIYATPAAGAAVLAAGTALAKAVEDGTLSADDTEALVDAGGDIAEATGATEYVSQETMDTITSTVAAVDEALDDDPAEEDPAVEDPPEPLSLFEQVEQGFTDGVDFVKANPGKSAAGAALLALSVATGRRLL